MTNGERADRLVGEARQIAGEMKRALDDEAWNLATRRAQEVLLDSLTALSQELAKVRSPAFYQETLVSEAQAWD